MGIGADCDKLAQLIHESAANIQYALKRYTRILHLGAGDAIADCEAGGGMIDKKSRVTQAYIMPGTTVAQHGTDYVELTLGYGDAAAGALTAIDTWSTITTTGDGALTAGTKQALTIPTDGSEVIAAGKRLACTVNQNGGGKSLAGTVIVVELEYASDA